VEPIAAYRKIILSVLVLLTFLFGWGAFVNLTTVSTQASMDAEGPAFMLEKSINAQFPSDVHGIPIEVYGKDELNILNKQVLLALYEKSEALRDSEFGKEYLVNARDPILGGELDVIGMYTLADAVNDYLSVRGSSLKDASRHGVKIAITEILNNEPAGEFFRESLSIKRSFIGGYWESPAMLFFVYADNNKLGGGVFHRTVGGTKEIIQKEEFNREVEDRLFLDVYGVDLLGIGIDLNIEADEEAFSLPVMIRNGGLLLGLAIFSGIMLRSVLVGVVAFFSLLALLLWIFGFPVIMQDLVRPSVMTDMVLPLAFMVLGIDFFIYTMNRYKEERRKQPHGNKDVFIPAFMSISGALVLAMISDGIAFAANYVSEVEAIRSFAISGAFGAVAAFLIMGIGAPAAFSLLENKHLVYKESNNQKLNFGSILKLPYRFKPAAIMCIILVTIFSYTYIADIEKRLDAQDFVSKDSNFVKSLNERDRHWDNVRGEETIIYIKGDLDHPDVQSAIGLMMENFKNNTHLAHTSEKGRLVFTYGQPEVKKIDDSTNAMQIVVEMIHSRKLQNVEAALAALNEDLDPLAEPATRGLINEYGIAGSAITRLESLNAVTDSLLKTVVVAAFAIFAVLVAIYQSSRLAFITVLPMFFVIVWTYGLMGYLSLPLNFITATIAAVSLGVGIDYAVHIVHSYREERKKGSLKEEAICEVGRVTGFSALAAAITSIAGFAVLATAPMPLFATYGFLGMAMIAFSFIAAIVILPVLLPLMD